MSRIDYLLHVNHSQLEEPHEAYGGINFLQVVERQLAEGQIDLATRNIGNQVKDCFQLANLYWGQGNLARTEAYLNKTLERHQRLVEVCAEHDLPQRSYYGIEYAKCAACLLGIEVEDLARTEPFEPGYEPWFKDTLLSRCLDSRDFDMGAWQTSANEWTRKRHPKYRLEEFSVYMKALTGGYGSTDEMLSEHEKMFAGRARRNPDSDLLDGYHDNELIIDFIFAAILKRVGWEGAYRHSWPGTEGAGSVTRTTKQPDHYLGSIVASQPELNSHTGVIEDTQAARRFVDFHLANQTDWDGALLDAGRPAKECSKVAGVLKDLGWTGDSASLNLLRTYRMDRVLNERTHLFLCEPVGGSSIKMGAWTKLLSEDFGLHPDFIAIAGSEERTDYLDPQGAWYVYWKKDMNVYAIERDEWDRPEVATCDARMGIDHWPSYTSFVAWWISEHLKSHT
ncbi:MAG: hypothetical protein ABI668_04115 [Sphingorhabdus sp.]